jgi:peroxiredoxin
MAVAALLLAALSEAGFAAAGVAAPNVELRGPRGQRMRLADFRGKVVLLEIWASWCPECQVMFPALDRLSREFRPRGVEVIAVNVDERRKDADAFLKTQQHQLRIMFDPSARVADAFDTLGVPASYLIDPRGRIRYTHEGYDETTDATYRREILSLLTEWSESSNRN